MGEVRAGLRAADAAVFVVSAADGVDEPTRLLWRECDVLGMPRAVAVTRLEQARADFEATVDACQRAFGDAEPLALPLMVDGAVTGLLNLLRRTVTEQQPGGGEADREPSADEGELIDAQRGELIESVIEESEDEGLLERYLGGEEVDTEAISADLRAGHRHRALLPDPARRTRPTGVGRRGADRAVREGIPLTGRGRGARRSTRRRVVTSARSPATRTARSWPRWCAPRPTRSWAGSPWSGSSPARCAPTSPCTSPATCSTSPPTSSTSTPTTTPTTSGSGRWPRRWATRPARSAAAIAGDIVVVSKLAGAETSDTLSRKDKPALVEPWLLPNPLLPVAIHAQVQGRRGQARDSALQRLVAEDVTMRLEHNAETHQLVLWAMGPAHVDQLIAMLESRYHVPVEVEPVRTSLRETFVRPTKVQGRLVKQSGGHGQYAVCHLEIEPLERGAGIEFVDKVVGGSVPRNFIPSVEKGARTQLEKGVLAGYPVVDVRITLVDGKAHSVDSSDMAFQTAAGMALREAANDSTVAMLEPVDEVHIEVSDDAVGGVLADLRGRRGQVHGTEPAQVAGRTVIHAEVPAHELARYPVDLRSVSHGTGSFTRSFVRYDYMPPALAREVTAG